MSVAGQWVWLPWNYRRIRHNTDMNSSTGPLKVVIFIQFSQSYKSSEFKGRRGPEIQNSRDERQVQDSDNRFIKQKEFNV
jgi:hypothetical protein